MATAISSSQLVYVSFEAHPVDADSNLDLRAECRPTPNWNILVTAWDRLA